MELLIKKLRHVLVFTIMMLLITNLSFSSNTKDSILVKGITTDEGIKEYSRLSDVTINIYKYNNIIKSIQTTQGGEFEFFIPANTYLVVEFVKENYVSKRIIFDVRHKGKLKKVKPFDLEIALLREVKGIDFSELDFPITLVEYDKKIKDFVYNDNYTEQMLSIQSEIIKEIK